MHADLPRLTDAAPPIEPSADQRVMAKMCRGMYLAFVDEGFGDQQALALIGTIMAASIAKGGAE